MLNILRVETVMFLKLGPSLSWKISNFRETCKYAPCIAISNTKKGIRFMTLYIAAPNFGSHWDRRIHRRMDAWNDENTRGVKHLFISSSSALLGILLYCYAAWSIAYCILYFFSPRSVYIAENTSTSQHHHYCKIGILQSCTKPSKCCSPYPCLHLHTQFYITVATMFTEITLVSTLACI